MSLEQDANGHADNGGLTNGVHLAAINGQMGIAIGADDAIWIADNHNQPVRVIYSDSIPTWRMTVDDHESTVQVNR